MTSVIAGTKVLCIGVNYWPETTGIGPYTTGFAEHLQAAGAAVSVITAVPHYPEWRVFPDYLSSGRDRELHNEVEILRVRPRLPRRMSAVSRGLFEGTFGWRARSLANSRRPDVVIGIVPSLAGAILARNVAHRCRVPYGIVFQDLMGRSATQSRMAGSIVSAVTASIETRVARAATLIGVVTTGFIPFFEASGISSQRIRHLPNWAHIESPRGNRDEVRRRVGWRPEETIVLHAGNIGAKQHLEHVIAAAREARSFAPRLRFVIMGEGSRRAVIEELAVALPNVSFLPPQPKDHFPDMLAAADVLLVNERASVRDMSLPSKLTSYFTAGRPVVAAVRRDGTTAAEVERSGGGIVVSPDDPRQLAVALDNLGARKTAAAELGKAGRQYAEEHLTPSAAAARTLAFVSELVDSGR